MHIGLHICFVYGRKKVVWLTDMWIHMNHIQQFSICLQSEQNSTLKIGKVSLLSNKTFFVEKIMNCRLINKLFMYLLMQTVSLDAMLIGWNQRRNMGICIIIMLTKSIPWQTNLHTSMHRPANQWGLWDLYMTACDIDIIFDHLVAQILTFLSNTLFWI